MKERLQKIIAESGLCSRRKAEDLILSGKVLVNDSPAKIGDKADFEADKIVADGKEIKPKSKIYIMLNKPSGCICSSKDRAGRKTIFDIREVKNIKERVFYVGRLDLETTGLLILTNDGDFANKIMHPKSNVIKTYFVKLFESFSEKDIASLKSGIEIEGKKAVPSKVKKLSEKSLEIEIHEGRKHIIRKMLSALGHEIEVLKRIKIGALKLDIGEGKTRPLKSADLKKIFRSE